MSDPGLCGSCVECRLVTTGRSTFYLCERSRSDPRYRRYPPIPVRQCAGYVAATSVARLAGAGTGHEDGDLR
jgi:hypothetical protein